MAYFQERIYWNIYPNGDEVYIVDIIFISKNYGGSIKIEESECKDVRFFDIDNIPENISPPVKPSVYELIKRHRDKNLYRLFAQECTRAQF